MGQQGWIKLHRELMDKPIWFQSTPEQKTILITLLMMANHEKKEWFWKGENYGVEPGQFVSSLDKIAEKAGKGITVKNVRTAIEKFERLEFLANESTKTGRLISIVNWGIYQKEEEGEDKEEGRQAAEEGQTRGKQVADNRAPNKKKEYKNDNNDKKNKEKTYSVEAKKLFDQWNEQGIVVHRELTVEMGKAIEKALRQYGGNRCGEAIDLYSNAYYNQGFYYSHKWTLMKFLTQKNGIADWMEEGQRYVEYNDYLKKPVSGQMGIESPWKQSESVDKVFGW